MTETPTLEITDLEVSYGNITVLRDINATVGEGDIVSVVGANGAGKTTLLKSISGIKDVNEGRVKHNGTDITNGHPTDIVKRGITYVPERHRVFPKMTVRENLVTATVATDGLNHETALNEVFELFPILQERQQQVAETLSGGQQQMLAISQGLVADPEVIMLDEPTLGLAPKIVDRIHETIRSINESGVTVLISDEEIEMTMDLSDHMYLMRKNTLQYLGKEGEFESTYQDLVTEALQ